jgi:GT2 family glycosyltransferase
MALKFRLESAEISVIIPAYNRAWLIGETLRSLLNQRLPATEIIVVDDGSTDGTAETILKMLKLGEAEKLKISEGKLWPEFKVIRQDNAGPGAARNLGLAEATGEFIHFFDSDDIVAPNKHEVQLRALLDTGADIAYGPWVKGRFAPKEAQIVACGELSVASLNPEDTRYRLPATIYSGFTPEGPVLQAGGLPKGDLVKALLTNWSIVPHACLFRRSILEKAGGFPEDIWVGEDQMLFLRCLLAGAKVVHTPETMVFYRLGDAGKLTESKEGQRRRVVDWGRFLLKANAEVASGEWRVASESRRIRAEAQGRGEGNSAKNFTTEDTGSTEAQFVQKHGCAWTSQAGASASGSLASGLAASPVSESPTRSASGPESSPVTRNPSQATTTPSAWFGFRLRTYEAWRDLRAFFPGEYLDLEKELKKIWKKTRFSVFGFQFSGFMLRKLGGLLQRLTGSRAKRSFRVGQFTEQEEGLFPKQYRSK